MKKRIIAGAAVAGLLLIGAIGGSQDSPQSSNISEVAKTQSGDSNVKAVGPSSNKKSSLTKAKTPTCDGKTVTENCKRKGVKYTKYVYHPAVKEVSHKKTITKYKEKVTGYCTLCNDGTYSPSCATGRGACSWHGGVAQWNAPIRSTVPVYKTKKVIDIPAKKAYYEKVIKK